MEIIVTNHAREQYRERVAKWNNQEEISDEEIDRILKNVIIKRLKIQKEEVRKLSLIKRKTKDIRKKIKKAKPQKLPGNVFEFYYDGIGVAGKFQDNKIIIITCLGDIKIINWYRNNNWEKRSFCKQYY